MVRFAGDSGDGMQLTGGQFTLSTALAGNDLATFPDFPAEIRAPQGTTFGVSAFQINFGSTAIETAGDMLDVLVAMNPAALKTNVDALKPGGLVIADEGEFTARNLDKAKYAANPLDDGSLARWQVIAGKFLGQLGIMGFATIIGFTFAAGFVVWQHGAEGWQAFGAMTGASILLGAVFLSLGLLASASVQESSTAAGISIGLWLLFVAIYDMALLAVLVAQGGHAISGWIMDLALVLNPTDAYRLLTLGEGSSAMLSGMGGVFDNSALTPGVLVGALVLWCALPLGLAMAVFSRRNL